jgi:hypothetical protein
MLDTRREMQGKNCVCVSMCVYWYVCLCVLSEDVRHAEGDARLEVCVCVCVRVCVCVCIGMYVCVYYLRTPKMLDTQREMQG